MKTEIYWKAFKNSDARFDGAFVYDVDSTGLYCKPLCSARQQKHETTEIFDSDELEFINIRNADAGCLAARTEQA